MRTTILTILLAASIATLAAVVPAQEPGDVMNNNDMQSLMGGQNSEMGVGGRGQDRMDACGICSMQDERGVMYGRGRGMGSEFGLGIGPIGLLDLNTEQRSKLNKIQIELRKKLWSLKGKTIDEQARLYELYSVDRPDPKKIGQVYSSIFDVRRQMIEAKIEARNRVKEILTREQLNRLKQLQQNTMMKMYSMHRDMMEQKIR